jgi:glycosyltransferase involved in cell wall biosynthesis
MLRRPAAAHGDLLPTNLLYHDEDGTITFTDLEAFARSYHPLFDVLAFCTSDGRNLTRWSWQAAFLRSYLEHRPRHVCPSPGSREFRRAYRGILVFFLVYRLNEARVNLAGARYFDGLGKVEYARRKFRGLFTAGGTRPPGDDTGELADRRHSLREALSRSGFRRHFRSMPLEPAQADRP